MARVPAAQRRQQLIEAAFRVMERDGVAAATTRAIAAEAGAPLASFHYCFSSKEELMRELTPALLDGMLSGGVGGIPPGGDVREIIHDGLQGIWATIEATRDEQHVLYEFTQVALRNPELEDLARAQYDRYFAVGIAFLEEVRTAAGIEWSVPIEVVGRMMVSFIDGLALGWVVDGDTALARAAVDAFADGLAVLAVPASAA